jgi:hypothetical protein
MATERISRMVRIMGAPAGLAICASLAAAYIVHEKQSRTREVLSSLTDEIAAAETANRPCEGAVRGAAALHAAEGHLLETHDSLDEKLPGIRARFDGLTRACCETRARAIESDIERINTTPGGPSRSELLRQMGVLEDLGDQRAAVASMCGLGGMLELVAAAAKIESGVEARYDESLRTAFGAASSLTENNGPFGGLLFPAARLVALNAACVDYGAKWAEQSYSTKHWTDAARAYRVVLD